MFENNLIASASVESVKRISIFSFVAPCSKSEANTLALSLFSPTIIRLGFKLSKRADPSLKNSGLNIILEVLT